MSNLLGLVKEGEAVLLFSDRRVCRGNSVVNDNYRKIWLHQSGFIAHGMVGTLDRRISRLRGRMTRAPYRTLLHEWRRASIREIHDFEFGKKDSVDFLFGVGNGELNLGYVDMKGRVYSRKRYAALGIGREAAAVLHQQYYPGMPLERMIHLGYEALLIANDVDPWSCHGADFTLVGRRGAAGNTYLHNVLRTGRLL